jgi:hypothetical protein
MRLFMGKISYVHGPSSSIFQMYQAMRQGLDDAVTIHCEEQLDGTNPLLNRWDLWDFSDG